MGRIPNVPYAYDYNNEVEAAIGNQTSKRRVGTCCPLPCFICTTGTQAAAVYTATRTETAEADSGRLNNAFDKDRVQREIDLQRNVSQEFGRNVQEANAEINRHLDSLKDKLEKGKISQSEYDRQTENWQYGKVALNMLSTGLSAPTDSALGITAATASPAAAYAVGQYFKGFEDENGQLSSDKEIARVLAHGILSASVAALGGNDTSAAALSAAGAEAVAPIVSNWLYGTDDPDKLTSEQKNTVSSIASLGGLVVGGYVGGSGSSSITSYQSARNAIENNLHLRKGERARLRQELNVCKKQKGCDIAKIEQRWEQKAINNQKELYAACDKGVATAECNALRNKIDRSTYNGWKDYWYPTGMELSVSTDAALYAIFGGSIKADVAIGNRGAAAQFEGGIGIGIGAKAKAGKWEREDRGVSVSSGTILREKTFGSKPNPSSATLSTKASAELNVGVVNLNTEIVGGKEYKEDGTSSIYRNWSNNAAFKTQLGIGGTAKWDFLNYRTSKHEKILR
ncbi:VENN motif pre-toxin domain-containing protein [Neisseria sp.]|uniref:VENN motif pre-toxin domain-containing protein n=1 Tax=Neisseria sp. TaxID=192066 RepID=UPI0026DC6B8C|nr:VENN motif pre-toxin domain-containing protein [Neisseria sp.]MDO4907524.1 VENN motif pre-toxin domain-containing protein [Neisseria sp.]